MCSIPGLPTPGMEVSFLITSLNMKSSQGLVELRVSMDDDKKPIYEQMREEILNPQRKFCASEGQPDDLCLVSIDEAWHRARIVSIQNETYCLFLIDRGKSHMTTSDALAWGRDDIFHLPPANECCILANVVFPRDEWPEKVTKFLKCLPGKKFKGLVQHVLMPERIILLDIPVLSRYMCKIGEAKKINSDEFKILVQKFLHIVKGDAPETLCSVEEQQNIGLLLAQHKQYFYPQLETATFETVKVTEVNDQLNIFCLIQIFSKASAMLAEEMHHYYDQNSDSGKPQQQSRGDACAARGTDGQWRRALLKENMESCKQSVEVFFVDEGKDELVSVENIQPLLGDYLKMPVFTYFCCLSGLKEKQREWTADEIKHLRSLLINQTVTARFDCYTESEGVYYVTLYADDATCINNAFLGKPKNSCMAGQDFSLHNEASDVANGDTSGSVDVLVEAYSNTKGQSRNAGVDEFPINIQTKTSLELLGSQTCINWQHSIKEQHSTSLVSEEQIDTEQGSVGKTFNVKLSCIEAPQKIWCQRMENCDSLRHLMQNLQKHYESVHPKSLIDLICVARNPENDTWYRAKILSKQEFPTVCVRFIDYGQTQKVSLREVCPIDPSFLRLDGQAFQCYLNIPGNPTENISWTEAKLSELEQFLDSCSSSESGLQFSIEAVKSDEDGFLVHMVEIQTESKSVFMHLALKGTPSKALEKQKAKLQNGGYSTQNLEVGEEARVLVTFFKSVHHFYCQLDCNLQMLSQLKADIAKLPKKPVSDQMLELNSVCLARYSDHQWYSGQIVEIYPKPKVHFFDHRDTITVLETDLCPFFPTNGSSEFVHMQAIPLGLFDVPVDVPQEVNKWFADQVTGQMFTISVVAKDESGKLLVELFNVSLNFNMVVKEKVEKSGLTKMAASQKTEPLSNSSKCGTLQIKDSSPQKPTNTIVKGITQQEEAQISNMSLPSYQLKQGTFLDDERKLPLDDIEKASISKPILQRSQSTLNTAQLSCNSNPEGNETSYGYQWPKFDQNKTVEVYASSIAGPNYFWCQYKRMEDFNIESVLKKEGLEVQHVSPTTFKPGSPCLALFPDDNQWYRAQVLQKEDKALHVLFVDYGNESSIAVQNVKALPQSLLEIIPQAFLCSLNGFSDSKGSWDENVYDEFYSLMVDKPLTVKVVDTQTNPEIGVPQYIVVTEYDNVVINTFLEKYWRSASVKHAVTCVGQMKSSSKCVATSSYKEPEIHRAKSETVFASTIVDPNFFWCQFSHTEELNKVVLQAQESGLVHPDSKFSESLDPGSPCLALFSDDNQWYRAQVVQKDAETIKVLFIDYGNESESSVNNVRPLPPNLFAVTPQAFLCSLIGFHKSEGFWDGNVYDDFYNLVVDKPLRVRVVDRKTCPELSVSQYEVEMECEGVLINTLMKEYWRALNTDSSLAESAGTANQVENIDITGSSAL